MSEMGLNGEWMPINKVFGCSIGIIDAGLVITVYSFLGYNIINIYYKFSVHIEVLQIY
jgi:hypothetical protein